MSIIGLLSVTILIVGSAAGEAAPAEPASNTSKIRIVCFGDSITKGVRPVWGAAKAVTEQETFRSRVQAMLCEKGFNVEVINAGVGSDRTDLGLIRLDRDVLAHKPQFVMIMFGANDQCWDAGKSGPRLTVEQYESNLREMVTRLRRSGAVPVMMTPPPLGSAWVGPHPIYKQKGQNFELKTFAQAARRVSREKKTPLVDNYAQWQKAGSAVVDSWLTDGCHPNQTGHEILAKAIIDVLLPLLGGTARADCSLRSE